MSTAVRRRPSLGVKRGPIGSDALNRAINDNNYNARVQKISILIPAYNEAQNLIFVLEDLMDILSDNRYDYEIIVINDGSIDDTVKIVSEYDVLLINHKENKGKGEALKTGIKYATGDIIVTMDADGSHRSRDLASLIDPIAEGRMDAVIGSRFIHKDGKKTTTTFNIIGNTIFNFLIRAMTGQQVNDSQSGFRAFSKVFLNKIEITSQRFDVEAELTIKTLKNTNKWVEIPIKCEPRINGTSRLEPIKDGYVILRTILRYFHLNVN